MTPIYGLPEDVLSSHWLHKRALDRFVLDQAMVHTLEAVGLRRSWKAGDTLTRSGQRMESVSVCLSGQYKVLLNSVDGHSLFLRRITPGELYGVPSALAGAPFPTDMVCEEAGQTLEISRQALIKTLHNEPDLALGIIRSLATRVAEMFELMESDLLPSLRSRIYQRLQRLAHFNGQPDRFGHITITLTQQEFAQSLNASRPKVNAELNRLEKEGMVRLGYGRITLLRQPDTSAPATRPSFSG
ncbi:MAG TPA: Crp/Fnr family transcriptional regulator [Hydrogenophaga sp.]|uniref:Crp/Fnr family transcriptional regulator n=1 Tax=Hydrogenophaga sp. TaxID=1904254 RepID=UPI002B7D9743|nr:Crp/Fnr family transcriptional regulator [Hydrogenophaga sp.]HMN94413.1 Crp/Fnr family transcriptional regulator [Hydrogenophaga sp.]HMP11403.1 Crp/Fnr family transcriptional regulator [Hydrogenophaga sp.]